MGIDVRRSIAVACATALLCAFIVALTLVLGASELERGARASDLAAAQPGRLRLIVSLCAELAASRADVRAASAIRRDLVAAAANILADQTRLTDTRSDLYLPRWPTARARAVLFDRPYRSVARSSSIALLARSIAAAPAATPVMLARLRDEVTNAIPISVRLANEYESGHAQLQRDVLIEELVALAFIVFAFAIEGAILFRPLRDRLVGQNAAMRSRSEKGERTLSLLLSHVPATIVHMDEHDRVVSIDGSSLGALALVSAGAEGRRIDDVFALEEWSSRAENNRSFRGRLGDRPVNVLVEPYAAGHGSTCVAFDISHAERAARDLESTLAELARTQDRAGAGVWTIDLLSGSMRCSPQMAALLARPQEHVASQRAFEALVHPADLGSLQTSMNLASKDRQPFSLDIRVVRADGNVTWIAHHGEYRYDEYGDALGIVGTSVDITRRKTAEDELDYRVKFDALTDLPNRVLLAERIEAVRRKYETVRSRAAIVFISLDRFKHVNDIFGHAVGDALLQELARRLHSIVRATDTVSRIGGDEFVVLLEDIHDREDIERVIETIANALCAPCRLASTTLRSNVSIGVRVFAHEAASAETLLQDADIAMRLSKTTGGNRARYFDAAMRAEADERVRLEGDLRTAIDNGEFEVAYQPIVDSTDGCVTSFEALVRWEHPVLGLISPDRFISMIEASGHIVEVGSSVLREACRKTREWHDAGYPQIGISVNVSARQLQRPDFAALVTRVLAETGLPARSLQLELTESALVHDVDEASARVAAVRALGVRVAIDDFGTGYSSIAYLKHFNIDTVKIDRVFVTDLADVQSAAAIVGAIASLAHRLGARVIAEGVETAEQAMLLAHLQCDAWQGYYYGRPIPSAQLDDVRLRHLMTTRWPVDARAKLRVADRTA